MQMTTSSFRELDGIGFCPQMHAVSSLRPLLVVLSLAFFPASQTSRRWFCDASVSKLDVALSLFYLSVATFANITNCRLFHDNLPHLVPLLLCSPRIPSNLRKPHV